MPTMTPLPLEFKDLLKSLNGQGVAYMVIGGWAVMHHGYIRYTGDIDIWIAVSTDNADRLIRALAEFCGGTADKRTIVDERKTLEIGKPPLRVHIMCDISGVDFDRAYPQRVQTEWEGIPVSVIGLDALLTNKRATGRMKDRADVEFFTKAHKLAKRKKKL